jgi:hypothetical protein
MYEKLDENRPNVRLFTHYEHLHYPVKKTPLIGIEPTKGETNEQWNTRYLQRSSIR